ncbi:hypothetical protein I204_03058 [Kwoniella mangroviensis CBS 8886]|uniref:uncharacterized protein n=1 Tax=Kwoniella mangroviensis CBS 8507 TaxID=1296122 RepID=UPI00080D28D6|nr:uncharacterized protein I203_00116 [Kwoniella mangroviensis CBS 8507]OCF69988.1 hypothetical protein I203_00116 [Kwoniella mangroviensis CBS 8507]OCF75765.1 hypothetical protein I204_03058 [Kwoniella mangroviensis CBS 8886]
METQTPWTVDGFVGTPDIIDNEGNDYFQFNPSTPRYSVTSHNPGQFPQHSYTHPGHPVGFPNQEYDFQSHDPFALHHPQHQATFNGFQSTNFQLGNANELRNEGSHSSVRSSFGSTSHRSSSSVSSHYTWSTTTQDDISSSDVDPDDSTSLATSISPSLIGGQVQTQMVEDNKRQHGRIPSLSIDPKLFRPTTTASSKRDSGSDNEIEMLETAKPKSRSNLKSNVDKKIELLGESPLQAANAKKGKGKKERAKKTSSTSGSGSIGGGGGEGKKVSHARKQTADHIPRPRNAFILFRKHVVDSKLIPPSVEMRHQNVSIITAKMWSEAPPDQKAHFNELARIEKEEHMKKYPGYRYQPVYRRTNVIRRRVRKDEAEEQKCKSVAELLIKGKSGEDLENEIKEKIRNGNEVNNESNDKSSSEIVAKDKSNSNSRRSSAACELSKGALRALRAQARQQSSSHESGDWSDISSVRGTGGGSARGQSRSNSRSLSRTQSYAFEFEDNSDSNDEQEHEHDLTQNQNQGQDQMLGYGLAPSQIQGFAQQHQQLGQEDSGSGSGSGSWGDTSYMNGFEFGQPQSQPQGYGSYPQSAFTDNQSSTSMEFQPQPQTSFSDPSSSASQNFLYPQPLHGSIPLQIQLPQNIHHSNENINNTNNEFYTYDTALPFSPSAAITNFSFPYPHLQDVNRNNDDNDYFSMNMNMDMDIKGDHKNGNSEGIYEFTLPSNPNSTSIETHNPPTYLFNGDMDKLQTSQNQIDHNHHNHSLSLLPPSSGVPLENLPFDDHLILGDFEAALAHADESHVEGVW